MSGPHHSATAGKRRSRQAAARAASSGSSSSSAMALIDRPRISRQSWYGRLIVSDTLPLRRMFSAFWLFLPMPAYSTMSSWAKLTVVACG
jgi:hypothetical protein